MARVKKTESPGLDIELRMREAWGEFAIISKCHPSVPACKMPVYLLNQAETEAEQIGCVLVCYGQSWQEMKAIDCKGVVPFPDGSRMKRWQNCPPNLGEQALDAMLRAGRYYGPARMGYYCVRDGGGHLTPWTGTKTAPRPSQAQNQAIQETGANAYQPESPEFGEIGA